MGSEGHSRRPTEAAWTTWQSTLRCHGRCTCSRAMVMQPDSRQEMPQTKQEVCHSALTPSVIMVVIESVSARVKVPRLVFCLRHKYSVLRSSS